MNHNYIYSDSVSCEQLKAVDIISKEEGHVCPTSPLTPPPSPHKKINNNKQTNKKYTNIVQPCGTSNNTYLGVHHITYRMSFSVQLISVSIDCLHLPQCSELTCCCLVILCYAKLFIKKNLLLTMYYKENFMWNSIIVTTVRWIAINH